MLPVVNGGLDKQMAAVQLAKLEFKGILALRNQLPPL